MTARWNLLDKWTVESMHLAWMQLI